MIKHLKILVVSQYFWPENMRINDLVQGFVEKGHEVTVLTGLPNYPEGKVFTDYRSKPKEYTVFKNATVVRVPVRPSGNHNISLAFNYLTFFTSASIIGPFKLRKRKFDAIFVYAVSPITAAIPAIVIGKMKKVPVFLWILDLWPETLRAVGVVKRQKLLNVVGKLVSWIYNRVDYLLMQSEKFEDSVNLYCTKSINPSRIRYFPSWAEDIFSYSPKEKSELAARDDDFFTIVFAGNIGESQNFPAILEAVEQLSEYLRVRWIIVGDGRASTWLSDEVKKKKLDNVILLGRHPLEKMPALFAVADALLVSLKTNEVFTKTIPGKVQAYFASGRPIIAAIDGEAARIITESGAGMACASGDSVALAKLVKIMAEMPKEQLVAMGELGRQFYLENFAKDKLFDQLESYFLQSSLRAEEYE